MTKRFIPITTLAAAITLAGFATPVLADDGAVYHSREVRTSDLDLTTEQGAARLRERVRQASRAVCGRTDSRNLREMAEVEKCRAKALAQANRDADRLVMDARSETRQAARAAVPTGAR